MTIEPTELRQTILDRLTPEADSSYKISTLVPTRDVVLGVRVPVIRKLATTFRKEQSLDADEAIELMNHLSDVGTREEVLFGIFLLGAHQKKLNGAIWPHVKRWIDACDNWEICDQLAIIYGGIVAKDLSLVETLMPSLSSEHLWQRRFPVAVSTELNHRGRSHPAETFRLVKPVLDDPEAMVRKAVAWALREVSKTAPDQTIAFLDEHGHRLARTTLRESLKKLPEADRDRLMTRFAP